MPPIGQINLTGFARQALSNTARLPGQRSENIQEIRQKLAADRVSQTQGRQFNRALIRNQEEFANTQVVTAAFRSALRNRNNPVNERNQPRFTTGGDTSQRVTGQDSGFTQNRTRGLTASRETNRQIGNQLNRRQNLAPAQIRLAGSVRTARNRQTSNLRRSNNPALLKPPINKLPQTGREGIANRAKLRQTQFLNRAENRVGSRLGKSAPGGIVSRNRINNPAQKRTVQNNDQQNPLIHPSQASGINLFA